MRYLVRFVPLTLLALVLSASPARSAFVSGTISGEVTVASLDLPGIVTGSLVTGSYTYDSSTTVPDPPFGLVNPFTAFSLSIGTNPYVFSLSNLDTPPPSGLLVSYSTPTTDSLTFLFNSETIAAFTGSSAVFVESVGVYDPQTFQNGLSPTDELEFSFTATPEQSAVPEPASLTLLGLGVAGFGLRVWMRRRKGVRTL
jgi:hypothetical protein